MNFGLKSVYKGLSTSDVGVPVLEATRLIYLLSMQPAYSNLFTLSQAFSENTK